VVRDLVDELVLNLNNVMKWKKINFMSNFYVISLFSLYIITY